MNMNVHHNLPTKYKLNISKLMSKIMRRIEYKGLSFITKKDIVPLEELNPELYKDFKKFLILRFKLGQYISNYFHLITLKKFNRERQNEDKFNGNIDK